MNSKEIEIVLRTAFAVLICADFAGNILVCLVVRRFPFMKTPMNYLLVHLAVCDMLVGLFIFPRHVIFGLYEHPDGLAGDLLCKFLTYGNLAWPCSCSSVFTLVVIAWERYNAVTKPLENRLSNRCLRYALALSWLLGILICMSQTVSIAYNRHIQSCDYIWSKHWGGKFDGVLWLSTVWCIPFLVMIVLYGGVMRKLWFHNQGIADVSQRSLQLSRMRITKTAVTVTVIFFLCFSPNTLYYFISSFLSKSSSIETLETTVPMFYAITHLLILLNSSINPAIYALQSTRFRRCMSAVLCRRPQNGNRISDHSVGLRRIRNCDENKQQSTTHKNIINERLFSPTHLSNSITRKAESAL